MVLFDTGGLVIPTKKYPLMNEDFSSFLTTIKDQPEEYADIDYWIKQTPEAMAIVTAIVTDIMSDGFTFKPITGKSSGKNSITRVKEFCDDNMFKEELKAALYDWLIYGDSYLWKGLNVRKAMSNIKQRMDPTYAVELKAIELKASDEDAYKKIRHVASTTMTIHHDLQKISHFTQLVNNRTVLYEPDEIIHAKLIPLQGKVYGWSPIMSLLPEMQGIAYIKEYNNTWFKTGGFPDLIFILQKETSGSTNAKALQQAISKYYHPTQKHGNLVWTGDVTVENLAEFRKDMEHRMFVIYLTGVLAMAFNMPVARVASIIGAEVKTGTGTDDATTDGYWKTIYTHQDYWETLLNTQFFRKAFSVELKFNRRYRQDEIREVDVLMRKTDIMQKLQQIGIKCTDEYKMRFLGLDEEDVESIEEPDPMQQPGLARQGIQPQKKTLKGQTAQNYAKDKELQAKTDGQGY